MSRITGGGVSAELISPSVATLSGDFTVSSTSWADVTGLSVTITAEANETVLCCVAGQLVATIAATTGQVTLSIDGTDITNAGGDGLAAFFGVQWVRSGIGIAYLSAALSAGSRVIKVRAKKQGAGDGNYVIREAARLSVVRLVNN